MIKFGKVFEDLFSGKEKHNDRIEETKTKIETTDSSSSKTTDKKDTHDETKESMREEENIEREEREEKKNEAGVMVKNGSIIVMDDLLDKASGPIKITSCEGIKLFINKELCEKDIEYEVTSEDKIRYESENVPGERSIDLQISKDKMEAFLSVKYTPQYTYKLRNQKLSLNLTLNAVKTQGTIANKYTEQEIVEFLNSKRITNGIIEKNLIEICKNQGENVLIAKGIEAIDDKPSEVDILFDIGDKNILKEDSKEKIDYKNVYSITNVEAGDILAKIIPSIIGQDGKDIHGNLVKRKAVKGKPIKTGEGCKIEEDRIIATKDGRPSSKNGIISVNNVYKTKDVDLKSGNINFIGDVEVTGSVKEGMEVRARNSILIQNQVDNATIIAGGEINIKGNSIKSKIHTGQLDMEKKAYLDLLNEYYDVINKLITTAGNVRHSNRKFYEIVRSIIENTYNKIPRLSLRIIATCIKFNDDEDNELVRFIRNKIMGLNIMNLKSIDDLKRLKKLLENEISFYNDDMLIQSDINIAYCQDSKVKSTGNIVITNKGEYVSELIALKDIEFTRKDAVARGGVISARGNIKLATVGSPAGVTTRLEVPHHGMITADIAYANTVFCFGKLSKTLQQDSRNVKAYLDKNGEIVIEKLNL